jgi:hypothetical protein
MAKDLFHSNVKTALEKDGWIISADPLRLYISDTAYLEIDLPLKICSLRKRAIKKSR